MEAEKLLNTHDPEDYDEQLDDIQWLERRTARKASSPTVRLYIIWLHILTILAFLLLGLSYAGTDWILRPSTRLWKPLSVGTLVSDEHSVDHSEYSKYSGPPSHENTKAWEELIQPTFIWATEQELRRGGESLDDAVRLADADGYLAALGVYHELHCLRQLRLHLYRDTYFGNLTEANLQWFYGHLDHCIETLRISIMCQADFSLYTFKWVTDDEYRPHAKSNAKRECVSWDQVEDWSMKRKVSLWPRLIRKGGRPDKIHL